MYFGLVRYPLSILHEIPNLAILAIREILQKSVFDNLDTLCHFDIQDAVKRF